MRWKIFDKTCNNYDEMVNMLGERVERSLFLALSDWKVIFHQEKPLLFNLEGQISETQAFRIRKEQTMIKPSETEELRGTDSRHCKSKLQVPELN